MSDLLIDARTPRAAIRAHAAPYRLSLSWPLTAIAAVFYGSLIPFEIDWTMLWSPDAFGLFRSGLAGSNTDDIITNLLVYIPVGLTLALCALPRVFQTAGRMTRIAIAVFLGTVISIVAEYIQTGIAIRVSSWTDVTLNAMGTAVGAAFGLRWYPLGVRAVERFRSSMAKRPFATLAPILAVGLLCADLLPFNFVTDTEGLHAAFGRAKWDLLSARRAHTGQAPFEPLVAQLIGFAWFTLTGFVWVRARTEDGWGRMAASLSAVKNAFTLACVIELMQLFTAWHVFDLATLVLRLLAIVFGVWCAAFFELKGTRAAGGASSEIVGSLREIPDHLRRRRLNWNWFLAGFVFLQVLVLLIANFDPNLTSLRNFALNRVRWIPMETLWHRSFGHAVAESASILVTFGVLAVTSAYMAGRGMQGSAWLIAGLVTVATASAVELLQCCTPTRTPDLSGPVLALVAVVAASRVVALLPRSALRLSSSDSAVH